MLLNDIIKYDIPIEINLYIYLNKLIYLGGFYVHTAEIVYVYNLNEDEESRFAYQKNALTELEEPSIEFLRNTPIAKVIYQNVDVPYLRSFEDEMKPMTDDTVSLSYSSNRYMELNKIGVTKGNTMLALAESLGIKQEETIAVGDNYNDMSMLLVAGLSVAAGNAIQDIKDMCGYTCENDNNEGVLAEVIEKFIF